MVTTYMMTIPRGTIEVTDWPYETKVEYNVHKRALYTMIEKNDVKKYIIAKEIGKNGYEHWQVRLQTSNENFFEWIKQHIPTAHVEKSESDWQASAYERKEGRFTTGDDTVEVLKQRFGKPNEAQKRVMRALQATNDRQVVVWYDSGGNVGKSWLMGHLWETGQAHICQAQDNVKGMIQDVASDYMKHGFRKYLVIDIPRTWKWTTDLYCAIERIKDGLIKDTRYNSNTINIRGVQILICTNTMPKLDNLSKDRWVTLAFDGRPL